MYKKGFTLIELLVTVLIIAILSSIAVSQYQKAIMKSRMTAAVHFFRKLVQLEQAYYDANGTWQKDITSFDIDLGVSGSSTNSGWFFPSSKMGGGRIEMLYAGVPQMNWVWNDYRCRVDFRLDKIRKGEKGISTSLQAETTKARLACDTFKELW